MFFGICIMFATISIALAYCFGTGMSAISRNPSKAAEIQILTYVGAAFIEFLVFLGIMLYLLDKFK